MCETKIFVNREEAIPEAARVRFDGNKIIVSDLLGEETIIENAIIEEIDFLGHTIKITRK